MPVNLAEICTVCGVLVKALKW